MEVAEPVIQFQDLVAGVQRVEALGNNRYVAANVHDEGRRA